MRRLLMLVLPVAFLATSCTPKPEAELKSEPAPEAPAQASPFHAQSVLIELSYLLGKDASGFARWCRSKEGRLSDAIGGLHCADALPVTRALVAEIRDGSVYQVKWHFSVDKSEWPRFKSDVSTAFGPPVDDSKEPTWVEDDVIYDAYAVGEDIPPGVVHGAILVERCNPQNVNHSRICP